MPRPPAQQGGRVGGGDPVAPGRVLLAGPAGQARPLLLVGGGVARSRFPMEAATEANGCMWFVPGSPARGLLPHVPVKPGHHVLTTTEEVGWRVHPRWVRGRGWPAPWVPGGAPCTPGAPSTTQGGTPPPPLGEPTSSTAGLRYPPPPPPPGRPWSTWSAPTSSTTGLLE